MSFGTRLRQHTASLDLNRGVIWHLGDGAGDARPIFNRKPLRQRPRPPAHRLDQRQLTIADAVKDISFTLSDYADVDFDHDVVQVRITPSLGLWLRRHTASLDPESWDIGQLGDGTKDARPIFGRRLLRQGCFDLQERHGRGQQRVADASHYVVRLMWPGAGLS